MFPRATETNTVISLSTKSLIPHTLALIALQYSPDNERPDILLRDREPTLRQIAWTAFQRLAVTMSLGFTIDAGPTRTETPDEDILTIELCDYFSAKCPRALRIVMERFVVLSMIALIFEATDTSISDRAYDELSSIAQTLLSIASIPRRPLHLYPEPF